MFSLNSKMNLIDNSKFDFQEISKSETLIKQIQSLIEIEEMKINFMNQKIKQSKFIFFTKKILEKKCNEILKVEIKKINSTNNRNKAQINLLIKENDFLQKMINYTRKTKLINQVN
jgi:hypothetical protein